jgi:SAM-dependent methyltransferase
MMTSTQQSAKDTDTIRQLVTGYQAARALLAADEINLLHHLQAGPKQVSELAMATKTHEPTLFRFLRALATIDLVIVKGRQVSKGPLADGLRDAARIGVENYRVWNELPYTLSTGNPAFEKVFGREFYEYLENEPEKAERFNTSLAAVSMGWISSVLDAVDFTGSNVVADIGGGHGTFLVELLKANLHLQGILIDQAVVLSRAKAVVESAGVQDRCRMESANFLKTLPDGADLCSLCNLLVDWDDTNANLILRNCHAAMGDGGRILVVDRVLPPTDDPGHRSAAFLDLFFLLMEGGRIRTQEEYEGLFEAAGFHLIRTFPVGGGFYVLEGSSA